jgi:O-antigen/teichoic acid export membrane protein
LLLPVASQIGHSALTNIVIALSKVAVLPLLAYALPAVDFGAYSLITASQAFCILWIGLGTAIYTYRFVPGTSTAEGRQILSTTTALQVISGGGFLLAGFLSGAVHALLVVLKAESYEREFVLSAVWLLLEVVNVNARNFLYARRQIGYANILDLIRQVGWIPLALAYWILGRGLTVEVVMWSSIAASAIAVLYVTVTTNLLKGGLDLGLVTKAVRFSAPLSVSGAAPPVMRLLERYVISASRSLEVVAAYSLVSALVNGLYSCTALPIETALVPRAVRAASEGDTGRARSILWSTWKLGSWTFIASCAIAAVALRPLGRLLGTGYDAALVFFPLVAVGYLCLIASRTPHNALLIANRIRALFVTGAVSLAVAVTLDFALIPSLGVLGAAIASLAGFAVAAATKSWASGMWRSTPWRELLTIRMTRLATSDIGLVPPEPPL